MANILIRDLPAETHRELTRRAQASGQSVQQYLVAELNRLVSVPTLDEMLERIASRSGGSVGFDTAVEDIDAERSRR